MAIAELDQKAELKNLILSGEITPEKRARAWEILIEHPELRLGENVEARFRPSFLVKDKEALTNALNSPDKLTGADKTTYLPLTYRALMEGSVLKRLGMTVEERLSAGIAVESLTQHLAEILDIQVRKPPEEV